MKFFWKSFFVMTSFFCWDKNLPQIVTLIKCIFTNPFHSSTEINCLKFFTELESMVTNICDRVRNLDICQVNTSSKRIVINMRN